MRRLRFALLCACLTACAAPPGRPHSPVTSAQRVLAIDFAPAVVARRSQALQRLPAHVAGEAGRAGQLAHVPAAAASEMTRVAKAPPRAAALAGDELARRPDLTTVVPSPDKLGQRLSDDLGAMPAYLGIRHRPLREIDDREHRTDPDDDRPEKSMWERISRRLVLRW